MRLPAGEINGRRLWSLIIVLLTVVAGIMRGLYTGPAPPSKFYVTYNTPLVQKLLGNFKFAYLLSEYISNNVGLWCVLFMLGSIFPLVIFDILYFNFYAITRMALYLGSGTTAYVLMMHGIYELVSIIMCSWASLSLFIIVANELIAKIKHTEYYADFEFEAKLLGISLFALVAAAFIEAYATPLLWGG
mgnify:CR=1 FL=1|jgi:uncharacterized membrane protein SpoIIM required for sporulation